MLTTTTHVISKFSLIPMKRFLSIDYGRRKRNKKKNTISENENQLKFTAVNTFNFRVVLPYIHKIRTGAKKRCGFYKIFLFSSVSIIVVYFI
jgi:hypothetical protein